MRAFTLRVAGVCLLAAWCGWATAYRTGTWDARITWWISTLTVVGAWGVVRVGGLRGQRRARPRAIGAAGDPDGAREPPEGSLLRRTWPWLVLTAVVVVWEALGIATGPHQPHLTISALAQAFRPVHAALLATWMGVGLLWVVVTGRTARRDGDRGSWPGRRQHMLGVVVLGFVPARTLVPGTRGSGAGGAGTALAVLLGSSRAVGVGFWLAVVGGACTIDAVARWGPGAHLTCTGLLRLLWRNRVVRTVVVIAWLVAGWHLFSH